MRLTPAGAGLLILLSLATQAGCESREKPKPLSSFVGFYHWGGARSDEFTAGISDLHALGARVVRFALSARFDIDYKRSGRCIDKFNLATALDIPDVSAFVRDPQLSVLIITAYDGAGFSNCVTHNYITPAFYTAANRRQIVQEYSDFVYRLRYLLQGTARQIILANWEGDNAVYCGSAANYVLHQSFKIACDASYPEAYAGNRGTDDSFDGMIRWLRARQEGVTLGNQRADADGIASPAVQSAIEISAVRMLNAAGMRSVLRDVVPHAPHDFLSYSSYESLDSPDPAGTLVSDLNLIRTHVGHRRIIIGEFGFERRASEGNLIAKTAAVLQAAQAWGVAWAIQWNVVDQNDAARFGMFDANNNITELGAFYRTELIRDTLPLAPLTTRHPADSEHTSWL